MKHETPVQDEPLPFLSHLAELRRTLLQSLATFAVALAVAAPLSPILLRALKWPLHGVVDDPESFLVSYEVAAGFLVLVRITFSTGLVIAAPWILLFIGKFVFPGLTDLERRTIRRYAVAAVAMFVLGAGFAFAMVLPLALQALLGMHQWMGITIEHILATNYIAFVTQLLLGFGLAFEMPVVLLALGRMGIITADQLRARRRHVVVILLVAAMLMTPQDIATQVMMALPLYVLFEVCILLTTRNERKQRDR